MPDSEISRQSPEVIYGDGKKRILESIAGQSALPPDLRTALAEGVERIFNEFAGRESRATASDGLPVAEEARDSGGELRERLMAELVEVWNRASDADSHGDARVGELESRGWFVSKQPTGVRFAKHATSAEGFILPSMPGYAKDTIRSYFDIRDSTPDRLGERVVVRLIVPGILDGDLAGRMLSTVDWKNREDVVSRLALNSQNAKKGIVEVRAS